MKPSKRLERIPPYAFAELERKIADKRAAGVDVISLGIGDPDRPTPPLIVEAMQEAVSEPETHQYPTNRGREDFRERCATSTSGASTSSSTPSSEIIPAIGAKEAIFNLNLAFLDPGDYALAADPGYPVYTGGPWLAGAEPVLMALRAGARLRARPRARSTRTSAQRAKLMFLNYPNNPTGAVVPEGFFERVVEFARAHEILVVHDNAYSEIVFDGYRAPSFLATPGAKEVGIEVFSLSKGYNMTGWRCAVRGRQRRGARDLLAAEDEHRLGPVRGGAAGRRRGALARRGRGGRLDERALPPPPRPRLRRAAGDRRRRAPAAQHDLRVGAGPRRASRARRPTASTCSSRPRVVLSPGAIYGPAGEGWFRISLTTPDERLLEAVERLGALEG